MRDINNNRVSYVQGYGDRTMQVNFKLLLNFKMSLQFVFVQGIPILHKRRNIIF